MRSRFDHWGRHRLGRRAVSDGVEYGEHLLSFLLLLGLFLLPERFLVDHGADEHRGDGRALSDHTESQVAVHVLAVPPLEFADGSKEGPYGDGGTCVVGNSWSVMHSAHNPIIPHTDRDQGLLLALIQSPLKKCAEVHSLLDALWRRAYGYLGSH